MASKRSFEGIVDRVGPLLVADEYGNRITGYALRLEGQPTVFHVLPRGYSKDWRFPQDVDWGMALTISGDTVSFEADEESKVRLESFQNHTWNARS